MRYACISGEKRPNSPCTDSSRAAVNVAIAGVMLDQEPAMTTLSLSYGDGSHSTLDFDVPWWHIPKPEKAQATP